MFNALNPYQLLAEDGAPVDRIELGRTPELSRCRWLSGGKAEWLTWKAFCRQVIPVRKKANVVNSADEATVGQYLLLHAEWLRGELNSLKTFDWDPADQLRAWLSPYLVATTVEEAKRLLDQDIALLRETLQRD